MYFRVSPRPLRHCSETLSSVLVQVKQEMGEATGRKDVMLH